MFGIGKKISAVFSILGSLGKDVADVKALITDGLRLMNDMKAALAEVRALTGHTATVTAMAAQASVPTSVPITLPPGPAIAAPSLGQQLGGIVGGVTKGIESVIPKP
jgi:hypothetical protein